MKKILIAAFAFLLVLNVNAQDAKKLLKEASKQFVKYNQDQSNKEALTAALTAIDEAFAIPGTTEDGSAWVTKGEIYNTIADLEMKQKLVNPEFVVTYKDAAKIAFEAFKKTLAISSSKGNIKDAKTGLQEVEAHLSNYAINNFQNQNYAAAYENFNTSLMAYELLKENGEKSRLDDEAAKNDIYFYTAISGYYGDKGEATLPLFKKLYEAGSDEPLVYDALYNLTSKKDEAAALKYLNEGREKFPDNTQLLFAQINYYLGKGELNKLINNLEAAMAAEPDNISVINTTGNVFEQLANKSKESGDEAKATEYTEKAKSYYGKAIEKDANNFDGNYSMGALYYNQAAAMTNVINELANDYSAEGTKKYDAAKQKMMDLFGKALPFFEKAYEVKEDDVNTMIALREIYVRQEKLDKAKVLKEKLGQ